MTTEDDTIISEVKNDEEINKLNNIAHDSLKLMKSLDVFDSDRSMFSRETDKEELKECESVLNKLYLRAVNESHYRVADIVCTKAARRGLDSGAPGGEAPGGEPNDS